MFSIKGKTFQFQMSDCHKIKTGICPIESGTEDIYCECNNLKKELMESDFVMNGNIPEVVYHTECGHYSCIDGQHRICIAGKMGRELEIIDAGNAAGEKCAVCYNIPNETECVSFLEKFD